MVRPLLEIERPWLTRDQAEAAIWRLTGVKNPVAVEQLLRVMDIYAVSQGPALIRSLRERDENRRRYAISLSAIGPVSGVRRLRLLDGDAGSEAEKGKQPASEAAAAIEAASEPSPGDEGPAEAELMAEEPAPERLMPLGHLGEGELPPVAAVVSDEWLIPGQPAKAAAEAWRLPDGRLAQRCTSCRVPKEYGEFHRDSGRWNDRATQCKSCRSKTKRHTAKPSLRAIAREAG